MRDANDEALGHAVERWARDDLRSVNAQVEFLLRRVLQEEGRLKPASGRGGGGSR